MSRGRITGVGGIFFKSEDPKALNDWYKNVLELNTNEYGILFSSKAAGEYLQFSPFKQDTEYFAPSQREFMINFRVDDLDAMLKKLSTHGIKPVGEIMQESYGNFAHIMDAQGNKIELWEPIEPAFSEMTEGTVH